MDKKALEIAQKILEEVDKDPLLKNEIGEDYLKFVEELIKANNYIKGVHKPLSSDPGKSMVGSLTGIGATNEAKQAVKNVTKEQRSITSSKSPVGKVISKIKGAFGKEEIPEADYKIRKLDVKELNEPFKPRFYKQKVAIENKMTGEIEKKEDKFESCVQQVKEKEGEKGKVNPWAVCHASTKKDEIGSKCEDYGDPTLKQIHAGVGNVKVGGKEYNLDGMHYMTRAALAHQRGKELEKDPKHNYISESKPTGYPSTKTKNYFGKDEIGSGITGEGVCKCGKCEKCEVSKKDMIKKELSEEFKPRFLKPKK